MMAQASGNDPEETLVSSEDDEAQKLGASHQMSLEMSKTSEESTDVDGAQESGNEQGSHPRGSMTFGFNEGTMSGIFEPIYDKADLSHSDSALSGNELSGTNDDGQEGSPSSQAVVEEPKDASGPSSLSRSDGVGHEESIKSVTAPGSSNSIESGSDADPSKKNPESALSRFKEKAKTYILSHLLTRKGVYDFGPDGKRSFWIMGPDEKEIDEGVPKAPKKIPRRPRARQIVEDETARFHGTRHCGGKHTITAPQQRGLESSEWSLPGRYEGLRYLKGCDGRLYRGSVPVGIELQLPGEEDEPGKAEFGFQGEDPGFLADIHSSEWDEILDINELSEGLSIHLSSVISPSSSRYCGGQHTKTRPLQRGLQFDNVRMPTHSIGHSKLVKEETTGQVYRKATEPTKIRCRKCKSPLPCEVFTDSKRR